MASTYSTNLKIELMALGDQAGSWGTTTDTNIGTALEQAIVGYGNPIFLTDADLTITLTDSNSGIGVGQVARNFVLNVTSSVSLTVTRNMIVPTFQKPYIIFNNTTGAQSIVVKTSAGTGITVPTGARVPVYVDGTNVVLQQNFIPSAVTAVTQIAGTNSTLLATTAFVQTAMADGSITTAKLADGAVTTAKLADNSVTTAKIVNGTILLVDLNTEVIAAFAAAGPLTGLNFQGSAAGGNRIASFTVDRLSAFVGVAGVSYMGSGLSLSFNGAGSGLNGMDSGSTPATGELSIYAIYNPVSNLWGTLGCLTATSSGSVYTGANAPAGYTASVLISAIRTDGSGFLRIMTQRANRIQIKAGSVGDVQDGTITISATSSVIALSLASAIPINAKAVTGMLACGTIGGCAPYVQSNAAGVGRQSGGSAAGLIGNLTFSINFSDLEITEVQTIYYYTGAAGGGGPYMNISNYTI